MFTNVLVPLDHSAIAEQAVGTAGAVARACHAAVDIVLVHRQSDYTAFDDERWLDERQLADEEQYAGDIAKELANSASVPTTHAVLTGEVVSSIVARAHRVDADLIVMTSHGRTGLRRAWLGSVADGVIRHSAIPVLMLRPVNGRTRLAPHDLFRTILVPVDGSPDAAEVLDAATALASCGKARLVLLRVVRPVPFMVADASIASVYPTMLPDDMATAGLVNEAKQHLAGVVRGLAQQGCADVDQHVVVANNIVETVLDIACACSADLIAMSTHGRGASRLMIGSVADKIVRGSRLPVLLYRPAAVRRSAPREDVSRFAQTSPLFGMA